MNRPKDCVVAVYGKLDYARSAIQKMDRFGFPTNLISLVSSSLRPAEATAGNACRCYDRLPAVCLSTCQGKASCEWSGACVPQILQFGDSMEKNAAIGVGMGGVLGLVAGAGVLMLDSGHPENIVPIMATSAIVGGILGAMVGWGVKSNQLSWYEQKVNSGHTLLVVHGDPLEVAKANRVLRETHPATLHSHGRTSADDDGICPQ